MKTIVVALAVLTLAGCEADAIAACAAACKRTDAKMVKWSKEAGCECDAQSRTTDPAQ